MNSEYFRQLDEAVAYSMSRLSEESEKTGVIRLKDIDVNDEAHKAIVCIALLFSTISGRPCNLELKFWDYIKLKHQQPNVKKKRVKVNGEGISTKELVYSIINHFKSGTILDIVYEEYYRGAGKKK